VDEFVFLEVIREEMFEEGLGFIKMRYLGDKQVLLTSHNGVPLSEITAASKESLGKLFVTLKPWGECKVVGHKVVWSRCRGLPLNLWTVDCFREILGNVGTIVELDDDTLNCDRVEYARFKVRVTVACKVQVCQDFWINDRVYQVSLEDASSLVECDKSSSWYKVDDCSDASSAMETRVGDSLKSIDVCKEFSDNEGAMEGTTVNIRCRDFVDHLDSLGTRQRSSEVDQLLLGKEQTVTVGRGCTRKWCMEKENLVHHFPLSKTVVEARSRDELVGCTCLGWVGPNGWMT